MNNNVIEKNVNLHQWIFENTSNSQTVLELGAGFFDKLQSVHPNVKQKIGIEIWQSYIDASTNNNCIKIQGDVLNYEKLVDTKNIDTVMMIDILEHFDKNIALDLLVKLIKTFKRVLLMIPKGNHPQNQDVTGHGAHNYQTHRSTWSENDFFDLKPTQIIVDNVFHNQPGKDSGCIFITWNN